MKRSLLLLATLLATGSALAQTGDSGTDAVTPRSLDLSIPKEPVQYRSDPEYSTDPPGTFYGDKTGPNRHWRVLPLPPSPPSEPNSVRASCKVRSRPAWAIRTVAATATGRPSI